MPRAARWAGAPETPRSAERRRRPLLPSDQAGLTEQFRCLLIVAELRHADLGWLQLVKRLQQRIRRYTVGQRIFEINIALTEHLLHRLANQECQETLGRFGMLR